MMLISGDFNADLDSNTEVAMLITKYINDHSLMRGDLFAPS